MGVGFSSGEAGPRLPGGAARQNIYEETVQAAEWVQETIPPDKVGPLCPVGHPMVVDLHRGVEWREHHPRGRQYLTRGACVDRCVRPVWLWGSGSGDTEAWLQLQWPELYSPEHLVLSGESIALKELLPVVLACAVWGEFWREKVVHVHCDNLGVVALVNSGYSKVPEIMHLLRSLFFIRAQFQIDVMAVHVLGAENRLADAISCNNLHPSSCRSPGQSEREQPSQPTCCLFLSSASHTGHHRTGPNCSAVAFCGYSTSNWKELQCGRATIFGVLPAAPCLLPLPSVGAGFDGICGLPLPRETVSQHSKELSGSSQVCPNCSGIRGSPHG